MNKCQIQCLLIMKRPCALATYDGECFWSPNPTRKKEIDAEFVYNVSLQLASRQKGTVVIILKTPKITGRLKVAEVLEKIQKS